MKLIETCCHTISVFDCAVRDCSRDSVDKRRTEFTFNLREDCAEERESMSAALKALSSASEQISQLTKKYKG